MNIRVLLLVLAAAAASPVATRAQEAASPTAVSALSPAPEVSGKSKRNGALITRGDVQSVHAMSAYEAVSRLRPTWLRKRGMSSINREGAILVYQDGMRFGGIASLHQINAAQVESIAFLDGSQATQRYGTGHGDGVVLVTTRH